MTPGPLPESYAVTASVHRNVEGWEQSHHLPTFYLDSNVQGIVSETHAARIARALLDPWGEYGDDDAGNAHGRLLITAVGL